MEVYIGTVMPFPYNFVPKGWMACNGQILPLRSYTPLYSLIGTYYGGDGTTTFGLPSLNNTGTGQPSRVVAGQGNGPGLTPRVIGEMFGENSHILIGNEMAAHNHPMSLYSGATGKVAAPSTGATLVDPAYTGFMPPTTTPPTTLLPQTVAPNGGGLGHPNDQPALQLYYCICYDGIFPSFGNS
jgi:microcystin-dependent protein